MCADKKKNYVFRAVIGWLTFITFMVLHDLAHHFYITYVTGRIYRGVSNLFFIFYIFLLFLAPCLLMPFIKEHKIVRTVLMAFPPFLLLVTTLSTHPKHVTLLVLLTFFAYFMILALEKIGELVFPFTWIELQHSTDAGYGIALYLFVVCVLFPSVSCSIFFH